MFDKNAKPSPQRQRQLDRYKQLVERLSPTSDMGKGLFRAYWVGGAICAAGQALSNLYRDWGLDKDAYLFNVFTYIARAGRKDDILQDLEKARWYLDRRIKTLKELKE